MDQGKMEVDRCVAQADLSRASGDLKGALAALDKLPRRFQAQPVAAPVDSKRQEILLEAKAKFNRDIADANSLRAEGKLPESRVVMDRIKAYLPPALTDEFGDYEEALRKLETREQEAGPALEAQKTKDVEKLRADCHSTMMEYLEKEKFDDGLTKIQGMMADPKYAALRADLEQELKDLVRARDFNAAIAEGGKNLIGQPLSVKGIAGILKSFDGNELVLTANGVDVGPHKMHDLRPKELIALAMGSPSFKSKDPGEQHLMCALYLLAHGQREQAGMEFADAGKAGADVSRYSALLPAKKPPSEPSTGTKKKTRKGK
jgi:hypothetical protein